MKANKIVSNVTVEKSIDLLGTTNISNIGDGTATGAISELKNNITESGNTEEEKMNIADKVNAIYSATYGQVKEKIDNIENNVDDIGNKYIENIYVGEDGKLHKVQGGADSVLPFSKSDGIILNELTLNSNAWGSAYEYGGSATSKTDSNIIINTNGAKLLSCTSISGTGKVYVHRLQENGTEIGSTQILNSGGIVDISSAFKILISAQTSVTCSWSRGSQGSNPSSSASITIKITNLKLS